MDLYEEKRYLDRIQSMIIQMGTILWFPFNNKFEYIAQHSRMWCRTCDLIFSYELKHRFMGYDNHGGQFYMRLSSVRCSLGKCQGLPFCSYKCVKQHIQKEHCDFPTRLTVFKPEYQNQHDFLGRIIARAPQERVVALIGNTGKPDVTDLEQRLYANTRV